MFSITIVLTLALAVLAETIETHPIIALILAALAIPGVTSGLAALIRKLSDALTVDPRVVVYVASLVITGGLIYIGKEALPEWGGEPAAYMLAWLAWATANAELARRVYELILEKLWGAEDPTKEPAPA